MHDVFSPTQTVLMVFIARLEFSCQRNAAWFSHCWTLEMFLTLKHGRDRWLCFSVCCCSSQACMIDSGHPPLSTPTLIIIDPQRATPTALLATGCDSNLEKSVE